MNASPPAHEIPITAFFNQLVASFSVIEFRYEFSEATQTHYLQIYTPEIVRQIAFKRLCYQLLHEFKTLQIHEDLAVYDWDEMVGCFTENSLHVVQK
jgi:hypothetical protein